MEKLSFYSCVSKPLYSCNVNKAVTSPLTTTFCGNIAPAKTDSFTPVDKKTLYTEKLDKLFPNNGFERLYNKINNDFHIDEPATIRLVTEDDGVAAGGFTFSRNEITLSYADLLDSDTKIVGIKDGKKTVLVSPSVKLPLFVDSKSAKMFVEAQSKSGNLGFDKLVAEPVTEDEQRKFIAQKIAHEVIHSQQHMIMRQTEGIGSKEVVKAWTLQKPKNLIEKYILDLQTEKIYEKSYWANHPDKSPTIKKDSPAGIMAKVWLEAVRNYPPVDSPDYLRNPIEADAYNRSAQYAAQIFK